MEIYDLIKQRHSVRQYKNIEIGNVKRLILQELIDNINKENNLNIQAIYDDENGFNSFLAHYGKFKNVKNYIVLIGQKGDEEKLGYFGEKIVLKALEIGLNSCFVGLTYNKRNVSKKIILNKGEKIHCVISIGYGVNQGEDRKSKKPDDVLTLIGEKPSWLDDAVDACLLAPTAINQQKFKIICDNGNVTIKIDGKGFYTKMDLGIVKYHFEAVSKQKVG